MTIREQGGCRTLHIRRSATSAHRRAHGQIPFFRLPTSPDAGGADVALLGVPHDGGTTYVPGARLAPYHVRQVSALIQGHHPVHGIDVFARVRCVDAGNVVFPPFDRAAMRAAVEAEVARIAAVPVIVGGDHSVTLPVLRALCKRHGPLSVVHLDAHLDVSGPDVWGDAFHHGTPMRHHGTSGRLPRLGNGRAGRNAPAAERAWVIAPR